MWLDIVKHKYRYSFVHFFLATEMRNAITTADIITKNCWLFEYIVGYTQVNTTNSGENVYTIYF